MADLSKDNNKWELSYIPDLLNEILYLCDRLSDEEHNAIDLLGACSIRTYKDDGYIDKEYNRLNNNINNGNNRKKHWQNALVDFGKEQIKKDESK